MKLLDQIAEKTILGALVAILRELRRLNHTLEVGIDAYRGIHGLGPMFPVFPQAESVPVENRTIPRYESDEPDWLRLDLLEALCRQHSIPYDSDTDLVALGIREGWLDQSGAVVTLPSGYGQ
jgi:hypothetical protein